jgi:hypothetical protein
MSSGDNNVGPTVLQTSVAPKVQLRLNIRPKPTQTSQTLQTLQTSQMEQAPQASSTHDYYDNTDDQKFHNSYGDSHVVIHNERSILSELKAYTFTDDIKNMADVIYNKMRPQVRRGKIRDQLLFYCVYCAYCELKRNINPIQLGKLFNLTQGEVQRCDSLFSPLQTGYRKPSNFETPLCCLPECCSAIGLSEEAAVDILEMAAAILGKDPSLMQENPRTVASGLLRYYVETHGIIINNPQDMTSVTNRSAATIETLYKRIAAIDNS